MTHSTVLVQLIVHFAGLDRNAVKLFLKEIGFMELILIIYSDSNFFVPSLFYTAIYTTISYFRGSEFFCSVN